MKYPKLFSRGKIGKMELKNRIVLPPMGTGLSSSSGEANDQIIKYYEERAKGGCALIITEITRVDDMYGVGMPTQLRATEPKFIPGLERLARAVHKHDSKLLIQLHHPGRQNYSRLIEGRQVVAPSEVMCKVCNEMPRALTTQECDELVKKFIMAANIAKMSTADGVELHGAHGYLINEFLSPYTNKRDDKYGGTFEKRMTFIRDIIYGIRATCGPDFVISVRISADEFVEGGLKIEDTVEISKLLESYGVDAINVSVGIYESSSTIVEDYVYKQAWKKHLAAEIKKNVKIPVIAVNNIKRPQVAEDLLDEGVCDFVALGRQQLADPCWGNKAKAGQDDEIRPCIACLYCFKEIGQIRNIKCTVNAMCGRELEFGDFKTDGNNRSVVVIGGGPAGMEAARVLAIRGFKVTLIEKGAKLGGTLNVADKPPHKTYLTWLSDNLETQIRKLGVEIRLNTEATVESVKQLEPYAVFVALGAKTIKPKIAGVDSKNVFMAEDVITGKVKFKDKNVVIVGGGVTGLETAETIGVDNKVTVVEMTDKVGTALYPVILMRMMARLKALGVEVMIKHKLEAVEGSEAVLKNMETGEAIKKNADAVILALGVCPDATIADKFKDSFDIVRVAGDAGKAGLISDAIREGFEKAFVLE